MVWWSAGLVVCLKNFVPQKLYRMERGRSPRRAAKRPVAEKPCITNFISQELYIAKTSYHFQKNVQTKIFSGLHLGMIVKTTNPVSEKILATRVQNPRFSPKPEIFAKIRDFRQNPRFLPRSEISAEVRARFSPKSEIFVNIRDFR